MSTFNDIVAREIIGRVKQRKSNTIVEATCDEFFERLKNLNNELRHRVVLPSMEGLSEFISRKIGEYGFGSLGLEGGRGYKTLRLSYRKKKLEHFKKHRSFGSDHLVGRQSFYSFSGNLARLLESDTRNFAELFAGAIGMKYSIDGGKHFRKLNPKNPRDVKYRIKRRIFETGKLEIDLCFQVFIRLDSSFSWLAFSAEQEEDYLGDSLYSENNTIRYFLLNDQERPIIYPCLKYWLSKDLMRRLNAFAGSV